MNLFPARLRRGYRECTGGLKDKMRIGILGGTFNPIHIGHLILAEEALEELKLDKVIFIPVCLPPHKKIEGVIDAKERYRMVVLATKTNPRFEVSKIEIDRGGRSYSVETLKRFKEQYGKDTRIFFITGSDSLDELSSWKDIDEILKLARFVVASRPGYPLKSLPQGVQEISISLLDISSSQIRRHIQSGRSIRYLVPEEVRKHILKKGLFNLSNQRHKIGRGDD